MVQRTRGAADLVVQPALRDQRQLRRRRRKFWVDTFADAPGHSTPGGTQTGTLYKGTNYVFCKVWGPEVRVGTAYNHWWMKTDLDVGPANQWVSAYYLSRWGNDEAKDNNGVDLPNCT